MTLAQRIAELERYAAAADTRGTQFAVGWARLCRQVAARLRQRAGIEERVG